MCSVPPDVSKSGVELWVESVTRWGGELTYTEESVEGSAESRPQHPPVLEPEIGGSREGL